MHQLWSKIKIRLIKIATELENINDNNSSKMMNNLKNVKNIIICSDKN